MADGTPGLESLDFTGVSPEEYARLVRGLSRREIDELTQDEALRARVLSEVFGRMEEQFQPEKAHSLTAVIRWKITGASEVVYDVTIADGTCEVTEGRGEAEPRATLVMGDAEFLKITSGNASPITMFMTRKLKVVGDVGLASKLTGLFNIPKAA